MDRSRRRYAVGAIALAGVAVAAVLVASGTDPVEVRGRVNPKQLPVGPSAPPLEAEGWLNSEPLRAADLRGKVVVYDFWTYSCVNCVRTIPYLRAWYARYRPDGLVIIGVHSPEFEFEKSDANVSRAVERLDVTWPVAFDDDMAIWNSFANRYWPAKYVTDRRGRVRYVHFGEGAYRETEDVLRELLGVAATASRAASPDEPAASVDTRITPETYLGEDRGPGDAKIAGAWRRDGEHVESAASGATIELAYRAREVNLVMEPVGAAVDVVVELDGRPLPARYRTSQTQIDAAGRTFVRVDQPDLFRLVLGPSVENHTVRLTPQAAGVRAFAFTFG
jgi:thiol-disulfide isomerase/thioredoxin